MICTAILASGVATGFTFVIRAVSIPICTMPKPRRRRTGPVTIRDRGEEVVGLIPAGRVDRHFANDSNRLADTTILVFESCS
jgi:hypothetical protein